MPSTCDIPIVADDFPQIWRAHLFSIAAKAIRVQDPRTYSTRHYDARLLANPTSCRRVAAYQSELRAGFMGLAPPRGSATLCTGHCIMCVALDVGAMLI